jgi:hypothetical protein
MTLVAAVIAVGFALPGRIDSTALELSVEVRHCRDLSAAEVMRVIALELEATVVAPARASSSATRVEIECEGRLQHLRVVDPITSKRLERVLSLAPVEEDVRSRAVALAAVELVLTSWMELTRGEPPPQTGEFRAPPSEARLAAEQHARRETAGARIDHVLAVAEAIGPFDGLGLGWGAGLLVDYVSHQGWWGAELGFGVARAEADTALGSVEATTWSGTLRPTLRFGSNAAWLKAGAGARLGVARLVGTPADVEQARGGSIAGTWGGPSLHGGAGIAWSQIALGFGIEAGYVLRAVSGSVDDGHAVAVDGAWVAGTIGVGWTL